MQPKTHVRISLLTYILATIIIVGGHSLLGNYGFYLDHTISRYIGLGIWSSILFLAVSIFIFINIMKYLKHLKTTYKMGNFWWAIAIITMVSLLGVGLCPLGFFDQTYGDFGLVSILHRISSSMMFCFSIVLVFLMTLKFHTEKPFFISSLLYIICGLAFIVCYMLNLSLFMNIIFIFESAFLAFFYIVLLFKKL